VGSFTPGPWHIHTVIEYGPSEDAYEERVYIDDAHENVICEVWIDPAIPEDGHSITEEIRANARLIARAPLMYKMLKALHEQIWKCRYLLDREDDTEELVKLFDLRDDIAELIDDVG